jgi:hypothetical protein
LVVGRDHVAHGDVVAVDSTDLDWAAPQVQVEHQPDWGTAPLK